MGVFDESDATIMANAFKSALSDYGVAKTTDSSDNIIDTTKVKDPDIEKKKSKPIDANLNVVMDGNAKKDIDKFIDALKLPAEAVKTYNGMITAMEVTAGPVLDQINSLQDTYGGISIDLDKATGSSKAVIERLQHMKEAYYNVGQAGTEMSAKLGQSGNILSKYFDSEADAFNASEEVLGRLVEQHSQFTNQLDNETLTKLPFYAKSMGITSEAVAESVERQIRKTGTANTTMLDDIMKFSTGLAKHTGVPLKSISANAVKITNDTQRLGDVTAEEATRIAATLGQLGQTYDSFTGALDKFQEFGSAAETSGLISQITGGAVNLDAQQLMYLASEEQEKFLPELRRSFLAGGVTKEVFEAMSNAEQKQLAQAVSMNKENLMSLLDTSRGFNEADLIDAQADISADPSDGFDAVLASMELAPKAFDDASKTAEYLRTQALVPLEQQLLKNAEAQDNLNNKMRDNVEIVGSDKIVESFDKTLKGQAKLTNLAADKIQPNTKASTEAIGNFYGEVADGSGSSNNTAQSSLGAEMFDEPEKNLVIPAQQIAKVEPVKRKTPTIVAVPDATEAPQFSEQTLPEQIASEYNSNVANQNSELNSNISKQLTDLVNTLKGYFANTNSKKEVILEVSGEQLGKVLIDNAYTVNGAPVKLMTT